MPSNCPKYAKAWREANKARIAAYRRRTKAHYNALLRQWRRQNRELYLEQRRRAYAKQAPEARAASQRAWRKRYPEKAKAIHRRYRLKNRERRNAEAKAWKRRNSERVRRSNKAWQIKNPGFNFKYRYGDAKFRDVALMLRALKKELKK